MEFFAGGEPERPECGRLFAESELLEGLGYHVVRTEILEREKR